MRRANLSLASALPALVQLAAILLACSAQAAAPEDGTITALGRLEAKDGVLRVSGPSLPVVVIAELRVQEGDFVEEGQVLAVLDSHALREAKLEQARAELDSAEWELAERPKTHFTVHGCLHFVARARSRPEERRQPAGTGVILAIPLAWLQLKRGKLRLLVALAGVSFAVVLIFMQLGFQDALFESSVRYHHTFGYDLAMISPKMEFIVQPKGFSRRQLIQVLGIPGVEAVAPVYLGLALWRNPETPSESRSIFVVGFGLSDRVFALAGVNDNLNRLRPPDTALYDARSRAEFGPVAERYRESGPLRTEVAGRSVEVVGLFELGTSFGIDVSIITSDLNFRRIFPRREAGRIDLGLIQLEPGRDPEALRETIAASIPGDVEILTREAYVQREVDYWSRNTPIG